MYLGFSHFSQTGYTRHIETSENPTCAALWQKLFADELQDEGSDFDMDDDSDDEALQPFAGDYFGSDYSAADFEWSDGPEDGPEDDMDAESAGMSDDEDENELDELTEDVLANPSWEPPSQPDDVPVEDAGEAPGAAPSEALDSEFASRQRRAQIEKTLQNPIVVDRFPLASAGAAMSNERQAGYSQNGTDEERNPYSPFVSHLDWEVARWAKLRGPGSAAVSELLNIPGLQDKLGLSYKNSRELNNIIDTKIPNNLISTPYPWCGAS